MMSCGQNEEFTVGDLSPLVAENVFLRAAPDTRELPAFAEAKEALPRPVWEGHDHHIACYWRAWEIAFMLMFGKYGRQVFDFQGTLDNFYSHQHRDGFICREIEEDTGREHFTRHDPSATGPEVLPWCEWEYFLNTGDKERLSKVSPPCLPITAG